MAVDRLWQIATDEFARAVESVTSLSTFALDEFVRTWQCSYFRFVRSPRTDFPSIVDFAAMAIATTLQPSRNIVEWARDVLFHPIFPERQLHLLQTVQNDCRGKDEGERIAPDWLRFDGDIIDAFDFYGRSGPLFDSAVHQIYRTETSYYYLCANHES
jgi:hypothetical protein